MKKIQLELYTRPTCSDCQEGKDFLAKHHIPYINYEVSVNLEKEKDLCKLTGTRMVSTFVFKDKSFRGRLRKTKVLIGFDILSKRKQKLKNIISSKIIITNTYFK